MTELKQLRDFAEQVNGIRPQERSLKGVVNNLISNYKGGGGSGMQIVKVLSVGQGNVLTLDKTTKEIYDMLKNGPVFINGYYQQENVNFNSMIISGTFDEEVPEYIFDIIQGNDSQYYCQIEYDRENDEWRFKAVE